MLKLIFFIAIILFSIIWTISTNKFLPREVIDNNQSHNQYDERQSKIIIEVLARSFVWMVQACLLFLVFRIFGFWDMKNSLINSYPEVIFLTIALIQLIFNYFSVSKKYSVKGMSNEK
ncbi:hypothetical protein CD111_03615 [Mammaliicoccus stepanovicii]|nr:hypothetical protein CD111_03615 [Mammaliicoccus stepanovicii]